MDMPFIKGSGFYLRELREADLEGPWYSWFNDSQVTRFQNKRIFPNSREKQRAYFEHLMRSETDVVLAIIDEKTKRHIGNVGLHKIDWVHRSAELGIVLGDKRYWGKGIGKKAWALITAYGLQILNLRRICAWVMKDNVASLKSAEAAGFKREGLVREMFFKNDRYIDGYYLNTLKSDKASLPKIQ